MNKIIYFFRTSIERDNFSSFGVIHLILLTVTLLGILIIINEKRENIEKYYEYLNVYSIFLYILKIHGIFSNIKKHWGEKCTKITKNNLKKVY